MNLKSKYLEKRVMKMIANKVGRPSGFSEEISKLICEQLVNGKSLAEVCRENDGISYSAVMRWLEKNEKFRNRYARAREAQADAIFDEILDIADNIDISKNGNENIQQARLKIDARKWMAGKLRPKKYSDKIIQEHSSPDGTMSPAKMPIPVIAQTLEEFHKMKKEFEQGDTK